MKRFVLTLLSLLCPFFGYSKHLELNRLVYEIRNPKAESKSFRKSIEKIGEYLALDILQELNQKTVEIETLTGSRATHFLCDEKPVLIAILRAGIPLYLGVQKIFPDAEAGFLGMSRNEETLLAKTDYIAIPEIKDKCVILIDTMLATGGSMLDAIRLVESHGPKKIIVVSAIASEFGIQKISQYNPGIKIFAAAIDSKLNEKGYIIPGLGDAGDRCYGKKGPMRAL